MKYVYFAERDGLIKIGCSRNPRQRATQLKARLLATVPGGESRERQLHRQFAAQAAEENEWFRLTDELSALIHEVAAAGVPCVPTRPATFDLYDRLLGGQLAALLTEWRAEGISFEEMAVRLREHEVVVTGETARRWFHSLGEPEAVA